MAASITQQIQGFVARAVSSANRVADGNLDKVVRQNHLGEPLITAPLTPLQQAGVEDSYYTYANTGTRLTGVAVGSTTGVAYVNTIALLVISNNNPVGGPDVIMDYLDINCDTVNTGGTYWFLYHAIDTGNRWASGGVASGQNTLAGYNAAGGSPSGVQVAMGAVIATAPTSNVRDIGRNLILNGVSVAGQNLRLKWANPIDPAGAFTVPTTAVTNTTYNCPAVVIHPQESYVINEQQTSRTVALLGEMFLGLTIR